MGLFDDLYGAVKGKAGQLYDDAKDELNEWWKDTEDNEAPPATYQQTVVRERLAEGSAIPKVQTATTNTGATVGNVGYPSPNTTLYIGLGVGAVVLIVVLMLVMRGGK